jgi:hypothetical protein
MGITLDILYGLPLGAVFCGNGRHMHGGQPEPRFVRLAGVEREKELR